MSYTFNPFTGNLDVTPFSLDGAGKIPSDYLPIGSGGEVELNLGSAGSPSLFFNGDANTGLYSPGADQVAISTSGTGRLFVDASGQVGIGAAPLSGHQFTVNGSNLARICLQTAGLGQTTADGFSLETDSSATYFTNRENTPSIFYTNNIERLRIDSSGRLLVGTSSGTTQVAAKFQARAGTAAAQGTIMLSRGTANPTSAQTIGEILFTDSNEGQGAKINAVPDANWATNDYPTRLGFFTTADGASSPTERMRIDSDGNIGFGSSGYGTNFQDTVSINPSEGLISFGMDGRNTLVSGASGCYIFSGGPTGGDLDAGDLILQSRSNVDRRIIFATGSTPAVRMEIAGNGNVSVVGALSKGSGSFKIDHPLPEKAATHHLVHSFIEGPQADLIYRGRIQLVNGTASVNIDEIARMTEGTFEALCTNVCCFTSNESDWTAVRGFVSGSILTIEAQDPTSTADVCWMVVGERKDQHMLDTNWTDENGRVITEPIKQQPVA